MRRPLVTARHPSNGEGNPIPELTAKEVTPHPAPATAGRLRAEVTLLLPEVMVHRPVVEVTRLRKEVRRDTAPLKAGTARRRVMRSKVARP